MTFEAGGEVVREGEVRGVGDAPAYGVKCLCRNDSGPMRFTLV